MPLVFFFGSVVFPFGGQVSELKQNYSNCNIDFLLEETFFFPFEKFLWHLPHGQFPVSGMYWTPLPPVTYHLRLVTLVILIKTQFKGLFLLEHLMASPPPHTPNWLNDSNFLPLCPPYLEQTSSITPFELFVGIFLPYCYSVNPQGRSQKEGSTGPIEAMWSTEENKGHRFWSRSDLSLDPSSADE